MNTVLRPLTLSEGRLLRDDVRGFTSVTGLAVAEGYLDFPGALDRLVAALESGMPPRWWSHQVIDPGIATLVGLGGYKGEPRNGTVEIGYSVAPDHRGLGHATRAVASLLRGAADAGVHHALAHTRAEPNPSTRVLERSGFDRTATLPDAQLGQIWRWHRHLGADFRSGTDQRPASRSDSPSDRRGGI
ncbi:GNAT family protein [Solwaraspora sp. WMMD1047]|uniref:GNAT family N-acetyltransferase n=1 Tax=Solwaraspora sp. WMMD1047 TaxID=3016102 RepID=UPI002415F939|nr:GNAT family protein [Solwaraspora sp. WMMD1047]MDG4832241.1 GNAT family protein [Solwaraspora sp. WMMD1047]